MTLEQAKNLHVGQTIYDTMHKNADGTPARWRVNGAVKTWARNISRVMVPIKHGLYDFGYICETNLSRFSVE